jgi:hypothetical protein
MEVVIFTLTAIYKFTFSLVELCDIYFLKVTFGLSEQTTPQLYKI